MLRRDENNPILERDTLAGYDTLFNPGVCDVDGKVYMIVRATRDDRKLMAVTDRAYIYANQISDHLIFISEDNGKNFDFTGYKMTGSSSTWIDGYTNETYVPTYFGPFGTEDLRLCKVDDTYIGVVHVMTHTAYTGDHKAGGRVGLVMTKDFKHYKRVLIGSRREEGDRDAWIMKHQGKIAYFTRIKPDASGKRKIKYPSVQVVFFDTLEDLIKAPPSFWDDYLDNIHEYTILEPTYAWEGSQIGGGPILEHKEGYIMFYHGVVKEDNKAYNTGAALLDKETLRCIKKTKEAILLPEKWYETASYAGDTKNITFVNGARYSEDNQIEIYYGAADSHVAKAYIDDADAFVDNMETI
ncbi:hypothetical protein EZV73_10530 [Acidaminobacter sp. JC074]|uniref:glycoside hydrolase family 130 protein n=1 Tax=Acidaminobacter sp. JC074 TaxID=2530199 RepID=UPI001F0D1FE6|nr:hypothetical protein [Acidaminobacter sp. JC074]MCH4888012.1 hypothetical protein [Acidaminobacter sp. JC074]